MEPTVIKSFYGWGLSFDAVAWHKHIKKVEVIKKQMGNKYLLAKSNVKGKQNV